jgi:hypothetical protein
MDINLHIGAHRTASTTFQRFLERNTAVLGQSQVEVWTPARTRKGLFSGLFERPEDVTDEIERRGNRSCGLISIELARARRLGCANLLISDENIIGSTRNNLRQQQLYPLTRERLHRLAPAFAGKIRRIGLSIRSYDTFWTSCLAFGLTQNFRMPLMADLDNYVAQPRRWRDLIRDVATAFPHAEILVWPFERFAGQPEAQLSFLTGGVAPTLPMAGARDWNNPSPRSDKLLLILSQRGEVDLGHTLSDQTGRWMPFDAGQRLALRAQYSVDLDWLRRGADGLAQLVEKPALVANTDKTITISKDYDMGDIGMAGLDHSIPYLPPAGGRKFGAQDIMV